MDFPIISIDVVATQTPTQADWSNNTHKITSVVDPTGAQDAATKNYVDTKAASSVLFNYLTAR